MFSSHSECRTGIAANYSYNYNQLSNWRHFPDGSFRRTQLLNQTRKPAEELVFGAEVKELPELIQVSSAPNSTFLCAMEETASDLHGRPKMSSWVLHLAWLGPRCHRHLRTEVGDNSSLCQMNDQNSEALSVQRQLES